MIQVILGGKGSGKTKLLLDKTNNALKAEHGNGNIIFIDDDKRYMYDLRHEIRFVDASNYSAASKCSADAFLAFISGMLAADFDITLIAIDAFLKLVVTPMNELRNFFEELEKLSASHNCNFFLSISAPEEEVPEFIKQYSIAAEA
ncbi:MAG: hypothetical protein IJC56_10215 [Clostridia bacterium]|nr:hypothetical protein [Clostridia bacterium]